MSKPNTISCTARYDDTKHVRCQVGCFSSNLARVKCPEILESYPYSIAQTLNEPLRFDFSRRYLCGRHSCKMQFFFQNMFDCCTNNTHNKHSFDFIKNISTNLLGVRLDCGTDRFCKASIFLLLHCLHFRTVFLLDFSLVAAFLNPLFWKLAYINWKRVLFGE